MIILIVVACAILALQISCESSLADYIKKLFGLDLNSQKRVHRLSTINFWNQLWGLRYMMLMYPLTLLLTLFFKIWYFLNQLLNCPYCLSFHLTWLMLYFYDNNELVISILWGLITIIVVKIVEKINE